MNPVELSQDLHLGVSLSLLVAAGLHAVLAWMTLRRYGRRAEPRLFAVANLLLAAFQILQLAEFAASAGRVRLTDSMASAVFAGQLLFGVLVLAMFFHLLATFEQRYRRPRSGLRSWVTHHLHENAKVYVPGVYVAVVLGMAVYLLDAGPIRAALADLRGAIGPTSAYLFGAALWGLTFVLFPARAGQEHLAVPVAGRALLLTSLGVTLGLLALWHDARPRVTQELLMPLLHLHSVPVAIFLALVRYEFAFMDRYVNGVVRTIAASAVVLGAYWLFHRVRLDDPDWGRLATSVVRVTILLGAVALAPRLAAIAGGLSDRHFFGRRFRPADLRRMFARRLSSGQGLSALVEATCADVAHVLSARGVHAVIGPDAVAATESARLRIPLSTGSDPVGWLLLGERRDLLPYFDGERAVLRDLAPLLAGAIAGLRQTELAAVPSASTFEGAAASTSRDAESARRLDPREEALRRRLDQETRLPQRWTTHVLGAASHVVAEDQQAAAAILRCLARVAHHVRPGGPRQVRLVEEMEFTRDLLALERVRRANRLRTSLHFPATLNDQAVPRGVMVRLLGRVLAEPVGTASAPIDLEVLARVAEGRVEIEVHAPEGSGGNLRGQFARRVLPARAASTS
jgi:hypothetical protein